jgi:hypothetical protein
MHIAWSSTLYSFCLSYTSYWSNLNSSYSLFITSEDLRMHWLKCLSCDIRLVVSQLISCAKVVCCDLGIGSMWKMVQLAIETFQKKLCCIRLSTLCPQIKVQPQCPLLCSCQKKKWKRKRKKRIEKEVLPSSFLNKWLCLGISNVPNFSLSPLPPCIHICFIKISGIVAHY